MTFNIRRDLMQDGTDSWEYRKEKVIQIIKDLKIDVFGIQEGLPHMIKYMENKLTEYTMIGQGRNNEKSDEYNAIFYKTKSFISLDRGQFWLSETPSVPGSIGWGSKYPRICTWSEFAHIKNSSSSFYVFNTHLDNSSQLARVYGIKLIIEQIIFLLEKSIPVILMGDFNCERNNYVINYVEKIGLFQPCLKGKTFHNFNGGICGKLIDYLFVSNQIKFIESFINRRSFEEKYPSDHYPVIAKIQL